MTVRMRRRMTVACCLVLALAASACGEDDAAEPAATETGAAEPTATEAGAATTPATEPTGTASPATEGETEGGGEVAAMDCTEMDELEVSVPTHPPKFAHMPPVMAGEVGFYEDFCIDMTVTRYGSGPAALRALQAGETELGLPPTNAAIVAVGQDSPITVVGAPASVLPQVIVATEEITSCEDLEGQTVGTGGPGDLIHFQMTLFLDSCGLDIESDVEVFVGPPGDFGPQMAQGVIQATVMHVDDVPFHERGQDITLNVLQTSAELVPDFGYQMYVARDDWLAEEGNRDAVVRMNAAILATNRWMRDPANQEEMLDIAARITERDRDIMAYAYDIYVENFPSTCDEALSESSFEYSMELQVELGEMPSPVSYDDVIDRSICEDAEALLE